MTNLRKKNPQGVGSSGTKRFIIRKYVMAKNVTEAIKKERGIEAEEVWLDQDWVKLQDEISKDIGYGRE